MKKPSRWPADSSAKTVIILARAGRQLAAAARAAGFVPLVADLFGDSDTRHLAARWVGVAAATDFHFDPDSLQLAVTALRAEAPQAPLVYGTGFEAEADLLATVTRGAVVLGNAVDTLRFLAQPDRLAERLRQLDIPTPAVRLQAVPSVGQWLVKTQGEAGGWHVRWGVPGETLQAPAFAQAFMPGRSLSVAAVVGAHEVAVLGFCEHLFWPGADRPFQYGGAAVVRDLGPRLREHLTYALGLLARYTGLRGLCGIDFVLSPSGEWRLIEINPRPTATFDLLARAGDVFRAHLAACRDQALPPIRRRVAYAAQAVVYASTAQGIPNSLDWPLWISDRPQPGSTVPAGAPVCTVRAEGADAAAARRGLARRLAALRSWLGIEDRSLPITRTATQPRGHGHEPI